MGEDSASWKIVHSLWILISLVPLFNGLGFIWIGSRVDEKKWLYEGLIYEIPFMLILLFFQINYNLYILFFWIALLSWIISIFRSFYVRNEFLNYLKAINASNSSEDNRWKLIHSSWILLSFVIFLNGLSFLWIGSRVDEKKWLYEGMFYEIIVGLLFVIVSNQNLFKIGFTIYLVIWFINIFRSFYVRNEFLDRLREHTVLNKDYKGIRWELTHSLWVLFSLIPFLNGLGFIWIGYDANNRKWSYEGIIYEIISISLTYFLSNSPEFNNYFYFYTIIWIISIFRSFYIKSEYLNCLIESTNDNHPDTSQTRFDLNSDNQNNNISYNKQIKDDVSDYTLDMSVIEPENNSEIFRININTASVNEIEQLPHFNHALAKKLVDIRDLEGKINSFNDLAKKLNLNEKEIEELKPHIIISEEFSSRKLDL